MQTKISNQKGFTLIELVVVMVILALLAAVAVPKFLDLQKQAEAASVKKVIGNLRSALSLRTAQALVNGENLDDLAFNGTNTNNPPLDPMKDLLSNKPESYLGDFATNQAGTGVWFDRTNGHWVMYRMKNTDIISRKAGGANPIYNNSIILQIVAIKDGTKTVGLELTSNGYDYTWNY